MRSNISNTTSCMQDARDVALHEQHVLNIIFMYTQLLDEDFHGLLHDLIEYHFMSQYLKVRFVLVSFSGELSKQRVLRKCFFSLVFIR